MYSSLLDTIDDYLEEGRQVAINDPHETLFMCFDDLAKNEDDEKFLRYMGQTILELTPYLVKQNILH